MKRSNKWKKVYALFLALTLFVMGIPANVSASDKISVTVYAYDYTALDAGIVGHSDTGVILNGITVSVDPAEGTQGALAAAADKEGIAYVNQSTSYGNYISSINGLSELLDGYPMSGWMASINGDFNNYSLTADDNNAIIRYHYTIEGYGTDINYYYSGAPTITSFTLAGQTVDVSALSENGSGTQADPYVIPLSVPAGTELSSLQASYQTTLNSHYVKFATDTGLTDISSTADYSSAVNCCLTGIDGASKTYYTIRVTKPDISLSLAASKMTLVKGSSSMLKTTVLPADAVKTSLSYQSSKTSIVSVNGSGKITAKRAGTATITVTAKGADGSAASAACIVTVKNPTVKFNVKSMNIQKGRSTLALTVSGLQKGDSVKKYKSSNSSIVSVSAKGKLTAKKKTGHATITVITKYGATATCKISVQNSAVVTKSLKLAVSKLTIKKGKTSVISVTKTPVNATDKVTYTSSNTKIASVSKTGVVTAKKKGSCKIKIKTGSGITKTVSVKVK